MPDRIHKETLRERTTVLLVDDHVVVRQGFRALLEAEQDLAVVGEAGTGREAVELARKLFPHVVLMDISMPQLNGLEATRQLRKVAPASRVLILSAHNDDEYIQSSTEVGAAGYLLKQAAATELVRAIREIKKGNAFFSPNIVNRLIDRYRQTLRRGVPVRKQTDLLTSREMEVLQLIAEGKVNKQIAAELTISINTVENHRLHLMHKLKLHDVAGLTRYAIANGIIEKNFAGGEPL